MASTRTGKFLFGGDKPWSPLDWTSSDDRVRGGSSYSELRCNPSSPDAVFKGNLDIRTLGGAGFASQRTTGEDREWDFSAYDGLELDIRKADDKQYTVILKDQLLPKSPNGREQSTISWEYDFKAGKDGGKVFVRWEDLKPTYRGREKKDADPLDLRSIKRISLMMRSFFGTQEGDFSLTVTSIRAVKTEPLIGAHAEKHHDSNQHGGLNEKPGKGPDNSKQGFFSRFMGACVVS